MRTLCYGKCSTGRLPLTQRWRFPSLPADDPQLKCTRCDLAAKEDITHCLWDCPLSKLCWQWGFELLTASSEHRHRVGGLRGEITAANALVATPLPVEWKILKMIWPFPWAILCWQVWKSRNEHFKANSPSDHRQTIRKSWH